MIRINASKGVLVLIKLVVEIIIGCQWSINLCSTELLTVFKPLSINDALTNPITSTSRITRLNPIRPSPIWHLRIIELLSLKTYVSIWVPPVLRTLRICPSSWNLHCNRISSKLVRIHILHTSASRFNWNYSWTFVFCQNVWYFFSIFQMSWIYLAKRRCYQIGAILSCICIESCNFSLNSLIWNSRSTGSGFHLWVEPHYGPILQKE